MKNNIRKMRSSCIHMVMKSFSLLNSKITRYRHCQVTRKYSTVRKVSMYKDRYISY